MKRKFYSWEECMNLREVKVWMVVIWADFFEHCSWNIHLLFILFTLFFLCPTRHLRSWTTPMWWNWRRSSEKTIIFILSLSIWRKTSTSSWRTGKKYKVVCSSDVLATCKKPVVYSTFKMSASCQEPSPLSPRTWTTAILDTASLVL